MREMKDSGIDWIGNIPSTWQLNKIKYIGTYINGYAFKPEDWSDSGKPIIRIQDLTGSNKNPNYFNGTIDAKYQISNGDILVSWAATLDAFEWKQGEGWLNQHIFRAIPNEKIVVKSYFIWLLKAAMTYMNDDNKHGIMMQHITLPVFNNFTVPIPNQDEQTKIATLITETLKQVEELIANQEQQIEKLKAYKQSLITETVTRGLNPDAPKKDSGVEWIGEIPETWNMMRGKGLFVEVDSRSADGNEELLTVSQYTGITPRSQKNVNMFEAKTLEGYKICEIGDIAANTMWLWAGAIGVSNYRGVISPSYNIYRQRNQNYNSRYLDFLLRITPLVQCYESMSTGIRASRLRLYPQQFLSILFPVPPMEEQKQIVEHLEEKCTHIDKLISIKQQKIEKLQQYKKSLIYEYVTGKREV